MLGFLTAELKAAGTFIELAAKPVNSPVKAKYIGQAREACEAVAQFSSRVELMESDKERIQGELVSLKLQLADLGEGCVDGDPVYNDGERFLLSSEQLRASAARMLIQNHELMNKNQHALIKA